jgi:hypothetical protein
LAVSSVVSLTVAPSSSLDASVTLSGASRSLYLAALSSLDCSATLSGKTTNLLVSASSSLDATVKLTGSGVSLSLRPIASLNASMSLTGVTSGEMNGMSVCAIVREILMMWGINSQCSAPDFALARAINDLNSGVQTVWNQAQDRHYWTTETLTVSFSDGASSADLPNEIQNIIGPCRLASNDRPLTGVGTISEIERFQDLYMNGETSSQPLAFHVERMKQSGDDPARCRLLISPAANGATDLRLDIVKEAPRYSTADLTSCPIIPIPHRYAESLLLPIARYNAASFYLFTNKDNLKESIDREYLQAKTALGMADPLPGKAGDNIGRREVKP